MNVTATSSTHPQYEATIVGDEAPTSLADIDASGISLLSVEGDLDAQVAALAIRSAQKQRDANRDIQVAEETALERAEEEQVRAMHEQADDIRRAGLDEGLAGMGKGALTMGAGFANGESEKRLYLGGADVSEAGGKWLGGLARGDEADHRADAARHEHEAEHHKRDLDAARDSIHESQDLLERALDFYKQSQQGADDAMSISVRRA